MAVKGPRPQSNVIRLATGKGVLKGKSKPRVFPATGNEPIPKGPVKKLEGMTPLQEKMWDDHIQPLFWLTSADSYKAYMWSALAARFKSKKSVISSAIIGQLRALGSELGMDPTSRRRLGTPEADEKSTPEAKYFDAPGD